MFERYTEKARRVVFFARYEASHYGSPEIDSQHLLLGLLREAKSVRKWIPNAPGNTMRDWIEEKLPRRPSIPTSVDLPLSVSCKKVLKAAGAEADRLAHRHIGVEHLLLGMLSVPESLVSQLLTRGGADAAVIRRELAQQPSQEGIPLLQHSNPTLPRRAALDMIEIHGARRNAEYVRDVVSTVRSYNYHWEKFKWTERDIAIHRDSGAFSFELSLAENSTNFVLVKGGWKKDHCVICRWELLQTDGEHGVGYTNGRTWLCVECCERFVLGDFFSSSQSEMT